MHLSHFLKALAFFPKSIPHCLHTIFPLLSLIKILFVNNKSCSGLCFSPQSLHKSFPQSSQRYIFSKSLIFFLHLLHFNLGIESLKSFAFSMKTALIGFNSCWGYFFSCLSQHSSHKFPKQSMQFTRTHSSSPNGNKLLQILQFVVKLTFDLGTFFSIF